MQASASDFTNGKEASDIGASIGIGNNSTALVVGCRNDRDGRFFTIQTEFEKSIVNVREALLHEALRLVGDIEVNALSACFLDLMVDRPSYNITWC